MSKKTMAKNMTKRISNSLKRTALNTPFVALVSNDGGGPCCGMCISSPFACFLSFALPCLVSLSLSCKQTPSSPFLPSFLTCSLPPHLFKSQCISPNPVIEDSYPLQYFTLHIWCGMWRKNLLHTQITNPRVFECCPTLWNNTMSCHPLR